MVVTYPRIALGSSDDSTLKEDLHTSFRQTLALEKRALTIAINESRTVFLHNENSRRFAIIQDRCPKYFIVQLSPDNIVIWLHLSS